MVYIHPSLWGKRRARNAVLPILSLLLNKTTNAGSKTKRHPPKTLRVLDASSTSSQTFFSIIMRYLRIDNFFFSIYSFLLVACCSEEHLLNTWPLCNGGRVALAEGPRLTAGLGEVLQAALGVSLHGVAARLPAGGADLAVLIGELEGLDQAQGLVDVAADGQVVDGDLAQGALGVDDEEAAQGDALLLNQHAVVAGNLEVLVGHEGQLQVLAQTALLAGPLAPRQVGEVAVGGDAQHGGVELLELGQGIVVGEDLGRADKGEVHGIEQEDNPRYGLVSIHRGESWASAKFAS